MIAAQDYVNKFISLELSQTEYIQERQISMLEEVKYQNSKIMQQQMINIMNECYFSGPTLAEHQPKRIPQSVQERRI